MQIDSDHVLCECKLEALRALVLKLEKLHNINITKPPLTGLVMIPAEDSLEKQPFYLGEALLTECEVLVDTYPGLGICLGDEPGRSYCLAVLDSLLHRNQPISEDIQSFLLEQQQALELRER